MKLLLLIAAIIAAAYSQNAQISVLKSEGLTEEMQNDALDVMRRTLSLGSNDRCVFLGDFFQKKYPENIWHVAEYNTYYLRHVRRINMQVGDRRYVLFAT